MNEESFDLLMAKASTDGDLNDEDRVLNVDKSIESDQDSDYCGSDNETEQPTTFRMLFEKMQVRDAEFIESCQLAGVIAKKTTCSKCCVTMALVEVENSLDGVEWRCPGCCGHKPVRQGSWFEDIQQGESVKGGRARKGAQTSSQPVGENWDLSRCFPLITLAACGCSQMRHNLKPHILPYCLAEITPRQHVAMYHIMELLSVAVFVLIFTFVKAEPEEACETLPSEIHITKEEFDELGRLQRTCSGDIAVNKCEGACNSQVQPSVITPTGFLKECYCCRESFLRERAVRLEHCYDPDGVRLTHEKGSMEVRLREPADCKCYKCSDYTR